MSVRNILGLWRFLVLRIRFRNIRGGLFFVDRGSVFAISRTADVRFGRGVRFMRDFDGHVRGQLIIGDDVFFNRGCTVVAHNRVSIGRNCLFGELVSLHDENHVVRGADDPIAARGFDTAPIEIGNNVWVGSKATILPGVCIGDNAVVGANAVVTRDVPANSIVGGVPARKIRDM